MTRDHDLHAELTDLMGALCERRLTPTQTKRLEELVIGNQAARTFYVEYMHIHAGLARLAAVDPGTELHARIESLLAATPAPQPRPKGAPVPPSAPSVEGSGHGNATPLAFLGAALSHISWISIAAVFAAVALTLWLRAPRAIERPAEPLVADAPLYVATLLRAPGCKWDTCQLPTEAGARLFPGRLRLAEGQALIEFDSGAHVLLKGPAVFELRSAMEARLLSGTVSVNVPEKARGFTVDTLSAKVIDLGTEFGLIAEPSGASEVHVLAGLVELESGSAGHASRAQVPAGQARRFESLAAATARDVPFDASLFPRDVLAALADEHEMARRGVTDHFDGDVLDPRVWRTVETVVAGAASVVQIDGHVELTNRGHLVTKDEFDPAICGTLRIRGRWIFQSEKDYMQILTRSDGEPDDLHGETRNGIECYLNTQLRYAGITERLDGRNAAGIGGAAFEVSPGDTVAFEVLDDGTNITFSVEKIGDDSPPLVIRGTSGLDFAHDYVVFHNRERIEAGAGWRELIPMLPPEYQTMISQLDDVTIEVLANPIPSDHGPH
ncbi:MAG: FecR domain-containing protein [Planctomycetia bacterium]|nr:FecR domain-containing protein [Planctomycetia bacterium]